MSTKIKDSWVKKIERLHPYQTLVYLGMLGSGLIFLFLSVAFLSSFYDSSPLEVYKLPKPFWLSTLVLVVSSFITHKLIKFYKQDHPKQLERLLWLIFFLGMTFTSLQLWGWEKLQEQGIEFSGIPSGSYLYVLTGIHAFHLMGLLIFALYLLWEVHQTVLDPIKDLVFTTNPYAKMKFRLFIIYWHYVDLIWLSLFLIFTLAF
ncbi:cytochrome c oxidase subunit 3 [Echinicola marina]|uniref:cytochrome c oxidase subunit 3 n=1 Tax=Echinicola marina TaxID=2859768 RepID=UPI001CF6C48F|nr:cytochrome c oxidase subunit 3 [Echinicola marina]UCS94776.1 cytochrome c oxidase subunit 3 [Echinicola marina]